MKILGIALWAPVILIIVAAHHAGKVLEWLWSDMLSAGWTWWMRRLGF